MNRSLLLGVVLLLCVSTLRADEKRPAPNFVIDSETTSTSDRPA
jgi:hypothetical protein